MSKVVLKCEPLSEDAVRSLRCESCAFQTDDYRTKWRDHLLGQQHQTITWEKYVVDEFCLFCERMSLPHPSSRMSKYVESKKRSCVVFGIGGLPRRDVLRFFCEKAVVTEFIFWEQRPQICLIEFLLPEAAEDVAKETKSILGDDVVVRRRVEISDAEWRRIRPMSVEMGVEEMEALEMRDGGPSIAHKSALKENSEPEKEERRSEVSMRRNGCEEGAVVGTNHSKIREASSQVTLNEPSDTLTSPFTLSSLNLENNNERCQSSLGKRKCHGCSELACGDCWDTLYKATQRGSSVGKRETLAGCSEFQYWEWKGTPQPATSCLPGSSKFPTDTSNTSNVCVPHSSKKKKKKKRRGGLIDGPNMRATQKTKKKGKGKKVLLGGVLCEVVCALYERKLDASKELALKVAGARKCDIETAYENLHEGLWAQVIHEFNFLVWENLLGFQLHEVAPADIPNLRELTKEAVQSGPLIGATLTRMDKLTEWARNLSAPKTMLKVAQDSFMNDWKAGRLKPTSLRPSRENAASESVFLRFDLRVVHMPPTKKGSERQVSCRLEFYNIGTSRGKTRAHFEKILKMYVTLFKKFCEERLKQL